MRFLLWTFGVLFLITFINSPRLGVGWYWDSGNAMGFAAFSGLAYLMMTSTYRIDIRAHQLLGYGVFAMSIAHAFWFLIGDPVVVEFVKLGAPDYMWLGVVGLLLLGVLIVVALVPDRMRVHKNFTAFKYWHQILAVSVVVTAAYHIVGSGFYFTAWYQIVLFIAATIAATFGRSFWSRFGQQEIVSNSTYLLVSASFVIFFVVTRNVFT